MVSAAHKVHSSAGKSSLIGIAVGASVVLLYFVAGLLFGSWNTIKFILYVSIETAWSLLLVGSLGIATVAIPVALYLYSRLLIPLALLVVITLGWPIYGFLTGILTAETVFGLGLYAVGLAPLYILLSLVLGGGEYYARKRNYV